MKKYLEDNGIEVVDAHVIQYGDMEFAVKKNDALGDTMPVLVDFAHGKPMFKIHTDHHDSQIGFDTKKTSDWVLEHPTDVDKESVIGANHYESFNLPPVIKENEKLQLANAEQLQRAERLK